MHTCDVAPQNTLYIQDLLIKCCWVIALLGCRSADLQDEEEDLNDINVERERSVDVLLWADGQLPIPDEELSVVD